jgi:transketolase
MAIADKIDYGRISPRFIYAMLSDGEHDEGQIWEAGMMAGKEKLGNLIAIIDRNNIQIDGYTENIMPLAPLYDKWKSFGWHVQEIDGHDMRAIVGAVRKAQAVFDRPSMIIAYTIPGKGVSFMERRFEWHGVPPGISDIVGAPEKTKQTEVALTELRQQVLTQAK